jgi:hypothetical protein
MVAAQITTDRYDENSGLLLKKLLLPNPEFELHNKYSASRTEVENYIAQHFNHEYGAQICSFLPTIMTMRCRSKYSAAVGLRSAAQSVLFLEQYLDIPVEKAIEKHTQKVVHRNKIIEIGNLVATQKGTSYLMFILVAAALIQTDNKWMVFTATGQVARILHRLNFKTITLCEANQTRLNPQDKTKQWGKYYNSRPQVLAGDLTQAFDLIHNNRLIAYAAKHYSDDIDILSKNFNRYTA